MNEIIKYICDGIQYNVSDKEYIIVTITSWSKRIGNVAKVLQTILNGNVLPDKININLAIPEFPNKEKDLPLELTKLINDNKIIEVNWLVNNTTVWKKSIPTMYKYPNAWILCIDDDFEYPKDLVETFVNKHKQCPNMPLSGVDHFYLHERNCSLHCGCASMDSLKLLLPYIEKINKDIFDCGDEDSFYTYCYKMNNINMGFAGKKFHVNMNALQKIDDGYSRSHHINLSKQWNNCKKYIN